MNVLIGILARAVTMSTPLLFGSLSEVVAERSGMMVTAIEGIFLIGAWGGFVGAYLWNSAFLGMLLAMACGLAIAAIYALVTVVMKQHQVVTGTALNIFVAGFCTYFQRVLFGVPTSPLRVPVLPRLPVPLLSRIPVVGDIFFNQNILTYVVYLLIPLIYLFLFRTAPGLTVRSTGENPVASDVAGISVNKVRFMTVLFSGVMGGIAGAFYTLGFLCMLTAGIIGGRGWIAFAICFLGNWHPLGAVVGTLFFGLAESLAIYMQSIGGAGILPNEFFIALPYILTIVLTVARRRFKVPAKLGVPYIKENG